MKHLLMALLLFSAAAEAAPVTRPVRIQIGVDPGSLDPNHIESLVGTTIAHNLYQTLVQLDDQGKIVPGLAEKYEISKNGRIYKFKLRPGAKWSDGKPVTVEDCIFGILDPLDSKTGAEDAGLLFPIKGAMEYYQGKVPRESGAVKRAGDWCQLELKQPNSSFLGNLTLALASPKRADQKGHFPGPTTGHYVLESIKSSEYRLAPNPQDHEEGQLPVEIKIIAEEVAALNLFETGKIDILTKFTPTETARLEKKGLIFRAPMAATNFLSFNLKKQPFDQLEWRKAVAASIDREGLGKALAGAGTPTTYFLPSSVRGYAKLPAPDFKEQQEKIRKLTEKPKISIGYAPSGMADLALGKIQNDLRTQLRAVVELEPQEQKVYFDSLNHHAAPPVYFLGNAALTGDPDLHLREFVADPVEHGNASNYHSDKFESLYKRILGESREPQRSRLIQQAVHVLQEEDVVVIPLFERSQVFALNPELRGFAVSPSGETPFHRLRWSK